jgi:hypothetical protein
MNIQTTPLSEKDKLANKVYDSLFYNASWVYEQRLGFFDDVEYHWGDLHPYEIRLNHFLAALVQRDDSVETYCLEHAYDDDFASVFTTVYVLGKRKGLPGIEAFIREIDYADEKQRHAVVDAVNLSLKIPDLMTLVTALFNDGTPEKTDMAARMTEYHRLDMIDPLVNALKQILSGDEPIAHQSVLQTCLSALGKLFPLTTRVYKNLSFLYPMFDQPYGHDVLIQLSITLFKARDPEILKRCASQSGPPVWPILPLGLYGHIGANGQLWRLLNAGIPEQIEHALLALGLIGSSETIDVCLQCLAYPDYAEVAAVSLQLITGANLYEDVFIPKEIDMDMLFAYEREKLERGEPLYPPGEETGETANRVIQSQVVWQQWYSEHKDQFLERQRYRYGKLITAETLLEALKNPKTPHTIRRLFVEELAIQYKMDVRIESNRFVAEQRATIEQALIVSKKKREQEERDEKFWQQYR